MKLCVPFFLHTNLIIIIQIERIATSEYQKPKKKLMQKKRANVDENEDLLG